jgi:hypothetical protein
MAQTRLAIDRVVDRSKLAAGVAKYVADTVLNKAAHQQIGRGDGMRRVGHDETPAGAAIL